ncbi:LOW QUALITY PROTEIN: probable beta-D-xylosidase 6 [Phalaenopsis equestris]|uniref:LOW QUALITY PROTEIN: probable beta-D-xylosidase 6 n=1 Tax=Phalaenopsis equestris TaxID=78828 RepID=UPI0009E62557|nr:LOW QUALITY PROTEIN: probable beta-D-xylosidase 6 [Phalaenopsis equestris]
MLLLLLSLLSTTDLSSATIHYPSYPCKPPHFNSFPFCNTTLPPSLRAKSLISHLTLHEKIQQLVNTAAGVPRLGLPPYEWWSESLHGINDNGPGVHFDGTIHASTVFPQVILSAASVNRTLWRAIARAVAVEGRAMHNSGQAGLTFWAPNINIFRDPRWGRGQETPGEDPLVSSHYAIAYVSAFQSGTDSLFLSACCKHYTAYDLEKWMGFKRYTFDANVTEQDMKDTFQPPFRSCVEEGKASCLMCSYNRVNGVPACARKDLIDEAREDWGFKGYVTSDCDAVSIIYEEQKYASSPEDAVAAVLKAGMDINCGNYLLNHTASAVKLGKVTEEDINRALTNLFMVQLRLGLYNGDPTRQPNGLLGPRNVCTKEHREIALEAARQGFVLLKNENGFLPLKRNKVSSLALIGPAGDKTNILGGDYSGVPCNPVSILHGLRDYVPSTSYASGCPNTSCLVDDDFQEAVRIAQIADVVVVVAGLNLTEETEELDRVSLLLPGKQKDLINAVSSVSMKPVILVLMGGGPIDVSFAKDDPKIASIFWIGYPGEVGGQVLAEAIFGEFNPGGYSMMTWYPESFTAVPMTDMRMRPDPSSGYPGRTHRFYTGETVYDFASGLSYTTYSYKFISAPNELQLLGNSYAAQKKMELRHETDENVHYLHVDENIACETLKFVVKIAVMNNGGMDGSHPVLLFSRLGMKIKGAPIRQLVGFDRVFSAAHKTAEVDISVDVCKDLSTVDESGKRILVLGTHVLMLKDIEHELLIKA